MTSAEFTDRFAELAQVFTERGFVSIAAACEDHKHGFIYFAAPGPPPPHTCVQHTANTLALDVAALVAEQQHETRGNGGEH